MEKRTCIIFNGYKDKNGYGIKNGKRAHRIAYENYHGAFDKNLLVCHSCDNPPCINPLHLFLGTPKDNMQDKSKKGRHVPVRLKGSKNPRAKLTWDSVFQIRELYSKGTKQRTLSTNFKVSQAVISDICRGVTWKT